MRLERFDKIIEHLKAKGKASYTELAERVEVSVDTVRRDLADMEEKGLVRRIRGGVVICDDDPGKKSYGIRSILHHDEKIELCKGLESIITDGQTVALNNGTTNIEAAKYLCDNFNRLNIITNSLEVMGYMLERRKFNIIVPGGIVDIQEKSLVGSHCEGDIRSYNIDVALLAVNAVSLQKGVTDFRFNEVGIIKAMLESAREKYVLADSSKFETVSCVNICSLEKIDGFLTDKFIDEKTVKLYENRGCKFYIN